jgi:general secretion pathway protein J
MGKSRVKGFTLVELLVALAIVALMATLSWRGLDGMVQARAQLKGHNDGLQSLQAGLAQWGADLDAAVAMGDYPPLDWDGRAMRITRRMASFAPMGSLQAEQVVVVAWARRGGEVAASTESASGGAWLRWQSAPLSNRGEWQTAWMQAAQWAQNPGVEQRAREVRLLPLDAWQIFFYRGNAWSNPLSAGDDPGASNPGSVPGAAASGGNIYTEERAASGSSRPQEATKSIANVQRGQVPDGIRLLLTLPPGSGNGGLAGTITRDWVRPNHGGRG